MTAETPHADPRLDFPAAPLRNTGRPDSGALEHCGPFYDIAGLTRWWGVSKMEIDELVDTRAMIAGQLENGQWVYPVWQFTTERTVQPGLVTLWRTLRSSADSWTCMVWLLTPQAALDDRSAVDWIAAGQSDDKPLSIARADAKRWGE